MRVFAVALRDAAEAATGPTVFEGLAQTDASGRYSLELPPGRYYIACGSVAVPTYHPGTTNVAEARPVSIASGAQVNGVDFSSFVAPAAPRNTSLITLSVINGLFISSTPTPPLSTTVSGTIRLQDGTPAKGMEVRAISVIPRPDIIRARADDMGRYRLVSVVAGNYQIVSGTDVMSVRVPVTVNVTQPVENKDFIVPGVVLRGRVAAANGSPAIGTRIRVGMTAGALVWDTTADGADGSYWVGGLVPGTYTVEASVPGAAFQSLSVTVGTEPVKDIDFSLPIAMVSGRILFEDGTPVPDGRLLGSAVLSTTDNPDLVVSSILPVSGAGVFGNVMEPGEYKVKFPSMTGYTIKSITAGVQDLLKESLKVTTTESVIIEIRLEK
jgi:hypothetical protein